MRTKTHDGSFLCHAATAFLELSTTQHTQKLSLTQTHTQHFILHPSVYDPVLNHRVLLCNIYSTKQLNSIQDRQTLKPLWDKPSVRLHAQTLYLQLWCFCRNIWIILIIQLRVNPSLNADINHLINQNEVFNTWQTPGPSPLAPSRTEQTEPPSSRWEKETRVLYECLKRLSEQLI